MRSLLCLFTALLSLISVHAHAKEQITITDVTGRSVQVNVPVQHIVLGEGRFLPTLGILDPTDPSKRVAGMMGEFKKYDPATYGQYIQRFPDIDKIPLIGSAGEASFNIEKVFTVTPDVAFFGMGSGHGPNDKSKSIIEKLEAAGIPVIILDFRIAPLKNTPKSIEILGKVMGAEKRTEEFLDFYRSHLDNIQQKLKTVETRPSVFMETHVGMMPNCCRAFGRKMMGRFIEWAGGENAFGKMIPGNVGQVNVEHLLTHQPDIYIGTAIGSELTMKKSPNFIALGADTGKKAAQTTLKNALKRTGVAQLNAIQAGKAYSIWHHFYNTPMHVVAVEALAKWFHPEIFHDLQPEQTLKTYFERFQAVPLNGIYWIQAPNEGAS